MSIPGSKRGTFNRSAKGRRTTSASSRDYGLQNLAANRSATQANQLRELSALQGYSKSMGGSSMPSFGGPGGGSSGGGGGYRRGGGGGGDPYAQAEAKRQAQLKLQRAAVERLFNENRGTLDKNRNAARGVLPKYRDEALKRLAQIYAQNQQQSKVYGGQINSATSSARAQLAAALSGLGTDLSAQGVDASGMRAAGQSYMADASARGAAASNFNTRLAQLMSMAYNDQRAGSQQIHQGAQSNLDNAYQAALAAMQAERTNALMGLV